MSNINDPQGQAPDLEPQLEAAVWSVLSEPVPLDAVARVKARAEALRPASKEQPVVLRAETHPTSPSNSAASSAREPDPTFSTPLSIRFLSRSLLMKSVSTVAAVVIVVGGTLLLQSSPSAYGEAIKQLREARSFTYVKHIYTEGKTKPIETKVMVAEDGRQRQEMGGGTISIMDPAHQIRLTLITPTKTALVNEPAERPGDPPLSHPLAWLEDLKAHGDKPDRQLGKKLLGDRSVEGFVTIQGQCAYTIWIDAKTKELIQVENEMPVKGSSITKVEMSDFRFNEKLDESLFSYDVPEGYKTIKQNLAVPKVAGGETSIVEALRGFTKRSAGKFPKSITEWGEWAVLFSTGSKDGQLDKETMEVMAHLGSIMPYLMTLPKDDYQYVGSGKTVDDTRCIVFWYRNEDAKLRAIYNDLTATDVEKKDLP